MAAGPDNFLHQISIIEHILKSCPDTDEQVARLHTAGLRTPLFMIQGLARLYEPVYKKEKIFTKLRKQSKKLEDTIGYYDHIRQSIAALEGTKEYPIIQAHCVSLEQAAAKKFRKCLEKGGWLSHRRIKRWRQGLSKVSWYTEEKELRKVKTSYIAEIKDVERFMSGLPHPLTDIELQVHELRRKLRWLSIYAQAGRGLFSLEPSTLRAQELSTFHTEEILRSPFIRLKKAALHPHHILLSLPDFIALSWLIHHIGELKDRGLMLHELDSMSASCSLDDQIRLRIKKSLGLEMYSEGMVLAESEGLIRQFRTHNVLNHLIVSS